jgi:predicted dehydrogenase
MMNRVLIIGCGDLGSRFLQAALQVKTVSQIDIVEFSDQAIVTAKTRMDQVNYDKKSVKMVWHVTINSVSSGIDLCIIATQADGREKIFSEVIKLGIKKIITEKVVAQSLGGYREIHGQTKDAGVKVWVNCKTRAYPIWKYIYGKIQAGETISYHSIGGNHGLFTNGLHTLDLFAFISSSDKLIGSQSVINPLIYKTKREKYDITGTFHLSGANNSRCIIEFSESNMSSFLEIVVTPKFRWVLDHSSRQAFEGRQVNNWILEPIPFDGDLRVSNMSVKFISDILENGECELPSLQDTYAAHEFLFLTTLPIFNKALNKLDDVCPCT